MPAECLHYLLAVPAVGLKIWGGGVHIVVMESLLMEHLCLYLTISAQKFGTPPQFRRPCLLYKGSPPLQTTQETDNKGAVTWRFLDRLLSDTTLKIRSVCS